MRWMGTARGRNAAAGLGVGSLQACRPGRRPISLQQSMVRPCPCLMERCIVCLGCKSGTLHCRALATSLDDCAVSQRLQI
jgi:hypothetical protein